MPYWYADYSGQQIVDRLEKIAKKGIKIKELPVKWKHTEGSKLNSLLEPISFFFKFWALLIKYKFKLGNFK